MTETITKPKKARRTHEELEAYHAAELKKLQDRRAASLKNELARLSADAQSVVTLHPGKPYTAQVTQAAALLKAASDSIKVEVKQ